MIDIILLLFWGISSPNRYHYLLNTSFPRGTFEARVMDPVENISRRRLGGIWRFNHCPNPSDIQQWWRPRR